jgi:LPS-assembly lipoprotein
MRDQICWMKKTASGWLLGLLLVSLLPACGYHLRGIGAKGSLKAALGKVYIRAESAPGLQKELTEQMKMGDAQLVTDPTKADLIIAIRNQRQEKRMHSIDPTTGKVREFQLILSAQLTLIGRNSKELLGEHAISIRRELSFDELAVLGKYSEEALIQQDLVAELSATILRKAEAVKSRR